MNAKASTYVAGGIVILIGTLGKTLGHFPPDVHITMIITVVGMLALAHVIGKIK